MSCCFPRTRAIPGADRTCAILRQDVSAASLQEIMDLIINAKSTINLQVLANFSFPTPRPYALWRILGPEIGTGLMQY